jgi:hypothetical protein
MGKPDERVATKKCRGLLVPTAVSSAGTSLGRPRALTKISPTRHAVTVR